jgi:drug/metabolite transporter (DMT)-like permease
MVSTQLGALAAFATSFTWAYASARFAAASRELGAARVNRLRALLSLPVQFVVAFGMSGWHAFQLPLRQVAWLLASALCSYAFADNLFFEAARRIGISSALAIASSYPLFAALFGVVVHGERLGVGRALGTLLCVGGVTLLVLLGRSTRLERKELGLTGLLLAFGAALLWAGNTVTIREGSVGISPFQANTVRYLFTISVLTVTISSAHGGPRRPLDGRALRALVPAIFLDGVIGSALFVYGLSHADLAVAAPLSSLAPLISMPIAIRMGEERWSLGRFFAIAATVAGAALLGASN